MFAFVDFNSDCPFEEGNSKQIICTVIEFTPYQSLVLCNHKCLFSSFWVVIIINTHLEEYPILVVEYDLANECFVFFHDDINLADETLFVKFEEFIAGMGRRTCCLSLTIVKSHLNCNQVSPPSSNLGNL